MTSGCVGSWVVWLDNFLLFRNTYRTSRKPQLTKLKWNHFWAIINETTATGVRFFACFNGKNKQPIKFDVIDKKFNYPIEMLHTESNFCLHIPYWLNTYPFMLYWIASSDCIQRSNHSSPLKRKKIRRKFESLLLIQPPCLPIPIPFRLW